MQILDFFSTICYVCEVKWTKCIQKLSLPGEQNLYALAGQIPEIFSTICYVLEEKFLKIQAIFLKEHKY